MPEDESITEAVSSQFATNKFVETVGPATTISTVRAPSYGDLPAEDVSPETDIIAIAQQNGIMIHARVSEMVSVGGDATFAKLGHIHPELTSVYNSVSTTSGDWNNTYTNVSTTSGDWNKVVTDVSTTSGDWNKVVTDVSTTSGDWNKVVTDVSSTSASWNEVVTNVNNGDVTVTLTTEQTETLKGADGFSPILTYDATTKTLTITNAPVVGDVIPVLPQGWGNGGGITYELTYTGGNVTGMQILVANNKLRSFTSIGTDFVNYSPAIGKYFTATYQGTDEWNGTIILNVNFTSGEIDNLTADTATTGYGIAVGAVFATYNI